MVWALNQHIVYKMSFRKIEKMLVESFGISCPTEVRRFRQRLAQEYQPTIEEIQHNVIHGPLLHADETTAKVRGFSSPYVWVFTNMDSVFYAFKPTREAGFLKKLLQGFSGVLVSDFYSGYDSLLCPQQKCLLHLIRDLNDDLLKHQLNLEFKEMVIRFGKLVRLIIETVNRFGLKKRHLAKHNKDVEKFYRFIFKQEYESSVAENYQQRFQKYREKLFTFLNYNGIPWNNNNAEAAIKPFASYRREAGVAFSEAGLQEYLTLLSIQQTCKYRGLNFLEFLKSKEKSIDVYTKKVS
jgi:transposase-like protein